MQLSELDYQYPEELIATAPSGQFRCCYVNNQGEPQEIKTKNELFEQFQAGDVLVINESKVLKRRVFSQSGLEILFLQALENNQWQVLFPAKKTKLGEEVLLPQGVKMKLVEKGIPQLVETDRPLEESYFQNHGELALPPYIQQARGSRHQKDSDEQWYQTDWAKNEGSYAAPTASLHFDQKDLEELSLKGIHVEKVTLHVGLGTFLPIRSEDINKHKMHSEWIEVPKSAVEKMFEAQEMKHNIWCLGTTALRAVESQAHGFLKFDERRQSYIGESDIFIKPGFEFKFASRLLTNFHQPKSTLLALVASFQDLETVKKVYAWVIERGFKLFSYGDLSVWELKK
ncbi:MAG: tRNA preQ1(34) S-adenosylmethionine ribosyltransferase-isomerase QueA [Bdellovibrionales bacterium]|nr:tRNA preQ1(34) S-adenosylmethionine ribosyltransferase-isomerase QueA [Bdellovibrionales bacterium]